MPSPTTRAPRWRRRLGALLVLAGIALLGYVGWQLYVTNWTSTREHRAVREDLERAWQAGEGTISVDAGRAGAVVRIPRFGEDWAVPVVEGVDADALAAGIGHFPGTAAPGRRGNFAIAGHRVTHGEPLRDMPALRPGDEVVVETRDATYTYVLDTGGEDLEVPFTDTWVVGERPRNPDPDGVGPLAGRDRLLTLTTCAELFHTDGRLVAFGHLEHVVEHPG